MRGTEGTNNEKRLSGYRQHVWSENLIGRFRVFCGAVGLLALLIIALAAIVRGTEGGLFAGSPSVLVMRFGKFAFFLSCLWGLFPAWRDYSEENTKQCSQRMEFLARIEQDPDWWRKRDEEGRQRKAEQEKLELKFAAMGHRPDSDDWEALQHSRESLATLTRQIQGAKDRETKP